MSTSLSSITGSSSAQDVSSTGTANASSGATSLSLTDVIASKLQPYLDRADAVETEINTNKTLISSYQQMQSLLTSLQSAASNLTTEALMGDNVFNKRAATMTSTSTVSGSSASDASTLLSASVSDKTTTGSHSIVVTQVAEAEIDTSNTLEVATTDALGYSGTFEIGEAGMTAATITVSATESLSDIAAAINSYSTTTGVTASVVAVDSTHSVLVLSGADTNEAINYTDTSGVLTSLGVVSSTSSTTGANVVQEAQGAKVTVDGVAITRDSNTISDALSGVTLNLKASDANTKVTLTVGADTSSVASAIEDFVNAYNNWESFVLTNEATDSDGTASSSAILFGDSTLRSASLQVDSEITSLALGASAATSANLSAIGITLNSSNELVIDTTTLSNALSSNYDVVTSLFQNTTTTTSGTTGTLKALGTNYSSSSGTLTFSYTSGTLTVTTSSGTDVSSSFSLSGSTISGASGTVYSGLSFSFTGTGTLGTATMTEGLANQLFTTTKNFGDTSTGTVQTIISDLQTENTTLNSQYTTLMTEAENYYTFLTNQYATLSTTIATYNQTLVTLKALMDADNNS